MTPEEKIINDIKNFKWHIINVLGDKEVNQYSYTIGLHKSFNHPEIVISGLKSDIAIQILESICQEIENGKRYDTNVEYDDILSNYGCIFKKVDEAKYDEYFGKAQWYYQDKKYSINQCFYPDKNRNYVWDKDYRMTIQDVF